MKAVRGMIRPEDIATMLANHRRQKPVQGTTKEIDFKPVVRLYLPFSDCQWLLTEMEDEQIAFGLADLGLGFPEIGSVWFPEIEALEHPQGLRVLQDIDFRADRTLSEYAAVAQKHRRIIT